MTGIPQTSGNTGSVPAMVALSLTVYNHPGVMTHICSLFARRAFNMESIFVVPINNTDTSRIWILVHNDSRLDQMVLQTRKLEDVIDVRVWPDGLDAFQRFSAFMQVWESTSPNSI